LSRKCLMTAANINFAVPTASNPLPNLSASQANGASVQSGEQSFSRVLQSRENAPSGKQTDKPNQSAAKDSAASDAGKQPADAKSTKSANDQQASTDSPQEAAQKALQAAQTGLSKPAIKAGAGSSGLLTDTSTTDSDTTLVTQPDASQLAAMAAANMAAQPASTAAKALPIGIESPATEGQTDLSSLLPEGTSEEAGSLKDLFQLASADVPGKLDAAPASGKEGNFNAALNTALDNQGGTLTASSQLGAAVNTAATQQTTTTRQVVATPVATQGWADEVGQKVSWAAHNGNGRAELILTPAHMGRIEVSINMNGDQASANFVAANAATREALQDAMPQLREVLANAGIQLGQANVSTNSGGQAWNGGSGQSGFNSGTYASGKDSSADTPVDALTSRSRGAWVLSGNGLVDTFA
jgi:flagellar hook-length control protein FliK